MAFNSRDFKGRIRRDFACSPADGTYYDDDPAKLEFALAMQRWRERHHRHPDCADVLQVARSLGYRLTAPVVP